jgi:hypothetical protein
MLVFGAKIARDHFPYTGVTSRNARRFLDIVPFLSSQTDFDFAANSLARARPCPLQSDLPCFFGPRLA